MKNKLLSSLTIAILASIPLLANAEYQLKIPLEVNGGGSLPNNSISIVDSSIIPGDGNGDGSIEPTEPTTPTEPEDKTITIVSNYQTLIDNTGTYIVNLFTSSVDAQPFATQLRFPNHPQFDNFSVVAPDDDTYNNTKKLQINGVECVIETHTPANRSVGCNASIMSKTNIGSTTVVKFLK